MKHSFDTRINAGVDVALWHADKNFETVMRDLFVQVRPSCFVETGTHMGWTSCWVAENYPGLPIHTVEVDAAYFRLASENLAPYPWAKVTLGSSPEFLEKLVPSLAGGTPLVWADAHWWQPVPLREECRIISESLDRYVVVVDDFECRDPDFEGDGGEATFGFKMCNLAYVAEWLGPRCWRPNYPAKPGHKGYGIFCRGVEYRPHALVKLDTL